MAEDCEAPHRFVSSTSTLSASSSAQAHNELEELRPHEVTVKRLQQSQARLEELEQQKADLRKARFREQREVLSQKSRLEREEVKLRQDEEKVRHQNEQCRKTATRMEARVKDLWNDHVAHTCSLTIGEAARLARLEEQQEVLDSLNASGTELPEMDCHLTGSIWENDREVEDLRAASKALSARRKEVTQAAAELTRLRASAQTAPVGVALVSGDEAAEVQRLLQDREELSRRLKSEAPTIVTAVAASPPSATTAASVPTVAATPVKSAVAPVSSPVASTAATATCAPVTGVAASPVATTAATATCAPVASCATVEGTQVSSSADDTSALPPPPAKAAAPKGKGKGKGVAPRLPPPPCKAGQPSALSRREAPLKKSNLLNLHWKVLKGEPPVTDPSSKDGGFSRRVSKLATDFEPPVQATQSPALALEASARHHRRTELGLRPQTFDNALASTAAPVQRDTVFSKPVDINEMPSELLEAYFKARTTIKLTGPVTRDGEALLDKKFLQMLGIVLQKHVMAHKSKGEAEASAKTTAVLSIKRAVLQCNYKVAQQEVLVLIRTVLAEHRKDGSPVTKRVLAHGEASLLQLAQSAEHRMIHEILKVPQIDERLESMLFHNEFGRLRLKCLEDMEVLKQALEVLDRKCLLLKKFFQTALKMGQGLNRDSRAPQAENGFQLTSLEKLVQTKSSKFPKHNVLHFVLALMQPQEAEELFTSEDIALLNKAKVMKSNTVHQDCQELVEGFYGVRDICDTGNYKSQSGRVKMERRRKTVVPSARPTPATLDEADSSKENEAPIDTDDCFHEKMKEFVDENLESVNCITTRWYTVFTIYKDLGNFFGDLNAVYPPPRDEKSSKLDLVAVFHGLAEHIRVHREEVEQDGLRALVNIPQLAVPSTVAGPLADGSAGNEVAMTLASQASPLPPAAASMADASTPLVLAPPQDGALLPVATVMPPQAGASSPTIPLQAAAVPAQAAAAPAAAAPASTQVLASPPLLVAQRHVMASRPAAAPPAQVADGPPERGPVAALVSASGVPERAPAKLQREGYPKGAAR